PADWEHLGELARARLGFATEAAGELVISPTALADFDRCPRQFHFRHGLGLAEGRVFGAHPSGDAAAMGTIAHAVLERLDFGIERRALAAAVRALAETLGAAGGLDAEQRTAIGRDLFGYVATLQQEGGTLAREVP